MALPKRIVVVCSGNTCRSAMAEAMLRKALADEFGGQADGVVVESAGLFAREGDPASENAMAVMMERGLDISSHRARLLREHVVESADLVLVMTSAHKRVVLGRHPSLEGKVFTLNEFAGLAAELGPDTHDPFGGSIEVYRATADNIKRAIDGAIRRIREMSTKNCTGSEEPPMVK
ncbi:MAG: low molecular weight protein arginine phosphatase [Bacillota bacterium]|nr:low molecular weight protein arginine phosphatase [Bacillota bacterium]